MKKIITFLLIIPFLTVSIISCTKDDIKEAAADITLIDIPITSTPNTSSINLSWKPVVGCKWYKISYGKSGETLVSSDNYQDLIHDPITYTISGLTTNTSYDIKIEGSDYLAGGKLIGSKTLTIKTTP
jgi:hypothetical protein